MTAYTGQTRTTLGRLCAALWGLPITASCDTAWIRTWVSVVTPEALRCSALDLCVPFGIYPVVLKLRPQPIEIPNTYHTKL